MSQVARGKLALPCILIQSRGSTGLQYSTVQYSLQYSTVLYSTVQSQYMYSTVVYVSYHVISAVCGEVTNMLTAFCTDIHCSYATFQVSIFVSRITLLYCMEVAFKVECP